MLIFFMPSLTAWRRISSGTPEEPCRTSGTVRVARSSAISARSSTASLVVIACEVPTATASASTPVLAT
jgi:hypothetical protein